MSTSRHWDGFDDETPEPSMPHYTCAKGHYLHEFAVDCMTCKFLEAEERLSKVEALERRLKDAEEIIKMQAQYHTHINGSAARSYLKKYKVEL